MSFIITHCLRFHHFGWFWRVEDVDQSESYAIDPFSIQAKQMTFLILLVRLVHIYIKFNRIITL